MSGTQETARSSTQLVFSDLTDYPVMAQALDNQWLPSDLAAGRQLPGAPRGATQETVEAGSAELRRALVNSGTLVVNRAYLLNNEALYRNYLPSAAPADRAAFARLLDDRVLVPFLYKERDPAGDYAWGYDRTVRRAWQRLLSDEAEPSCVRFSWDDEANDHENGHVGRYFSRQILALSWLPAALLKEHLHLSLSQAQALQEGILRDISLWANRQDRTTGITRNTVYEEFITRPGTEPHERLLREGEQVVPAKQLIDLLYSIGVPDKAGSVISLTAPDSPPRSVLDELNRRSDDTRDPESIGLLLRNLFADDLHRAVDGPNSYGSLSLSDVLALRKEEEWRTYIDALNALVFGRFRHDRVPTPEELTEATTSISRLHAGMLRKARRISGDPQGFRREIGVTLLLESAGLSLQLMSGGVSLLSGSIQAATTAAGALTMRLRFEDRGSGKSGPRGGLGHSITFPTVRLGNLQEDWKAILGAYGGRVVETGSRTPQRNLADQQAPGA
jgi:hypothetical protein